MKTAVIVAYTLIVVLAVVAFMQWRTIKKLTPVTSADPKKVSGDGSASFGDMINAVKAGAKEMKIDVTF